MCRRVASLPLHRIAFPSLPLLGEARPRCGADGPHYVATVSALVTLRHGQRQIACSFTLSVPHHASRGTATIPYREGRPTLTEMQRIPGPRVGRGEAPSGPLNRTTTPRTTKYPFGHDLWIVVTARDDKGGGECGRVGQVKRWIGANVYRGRSWRRTDPPRHFKGLSDFDEDDTAPLSQDATFDCFGQRRWLAANLSKTGKSADPSCLSGVATWRQLSG